MEKKMEAINEKPKKSKIKEIILENLLIILMIISVIIGVCLGVGLRGIWSPDEKRKLHYLRFPGDLLMNMLKMMIIPLIVSSLISSLAFLDSKSSGKMGLRAVVYYLTTTLCAVIIGIILVVTIRPGERGGKDIDKGGSSKDADALDSLFDLIRNCFPDNLIEACFRKQTTEVSDHIITTEHTYMMNVTGTNFTTVSPNDEMVKMVNYTTTRTVDKPMVKKVEGMNILGLVVFSIFFGCTLSRMGPSGKPLSDFFECMHIATMKIVTLIIWYSPVGIVFLIAVKLIEMEDMGKVFTQLGYYMLTVLLGLGIHGFVVLPLVYFIGTRKNPFVFCYNMIRALLTAWGTASSSSTLPVTMECLEEKNKIDIRVAKFVTPIGATINMDGTALYEAVASIFIAQYLGISLNFGEVVIISLTSTAAAIGAAGIPSAGLVTMAIVLTAVGLPVDEVTLIIPIDWFLDRFRTAINVLGDAYGAGLVAHLSQEDLAELDRQAAKGIDINDVEITVNGGKFQEKNGGLDNPSFTKM
ncbi:excitatory amino acid transporter 1-like isoform X2 [Mytilus californianus]|nr:excitatory amino acid transporter 1-like isoform X2 [Mytilus californianus]XP_052095362.1 excitatory amino acid transporter 1-like isoform X2 [Mytilus californianus]XP_052095371.1 excitatory amino acid transporter 1-like isoform X2 [Mytilus californianus]